MSQFEWYGKIPSQDFKESHESVITVYGEKKHKDGKHTSYLVDKNGTIGISTWKENKEVDFDSGTVALKDFESAKKSFMSRNYEKGGSTYQGGGEIGDKIIGIAKTHPYSHDT